MKKILLFLFVSLVAISCSVDDDYINYHYEVLPVESYTLPDSLKLGDVQLIYLNYKRPTDCYVNPSLYFEKDNQTRTVAVQSMVADVKDCAVIPDEGTKELVFRFKVLSTTPYTFKFYKGDDENGQSIFESVTVPVYN